MLTVNDENNDEV